MGRYAEMLQSGFSFLDWWSRWYVTEFLAGQKLSLVEGGGAGEEGDDGDDADVKVPYRNGCLWRSVFAVCWQLMEQLRNDRLLRCSGASRSATLVATRFLLS